MQLNTTKIKMDVAEYKVIIETHQQQMASLLKSIERFEDRFDRKIKEAMASWVRWRKEIKVSEYRVR